MSDGQSHTIHHCPECRAGRTFQLGRCVVCGHPLPTKPAPRLTLVRGGAA